MSCTKRFECVVYTASACVPVCNHLTWDEICRAQEEATSLDFVRSRAVDRLARCVPENYCRTNFVALVVLKLLAM